MTATVGHATATFCPPGRASVNSFGAEAYMKRRALVVSMGTTRASQRTGGSGPAGFAVYGRHRDSTSRSAAQDWTG